METYNEGNIKYLEAKKKIKRLKGFYIHATVYVLVNLFIIAQNHQEGEAFSNMNNYWTAIFWGIGLFAHGISVFVPNVFFGKDWEERKIRELMDKNK
ncbi:2TM domain-containing protein [Kaistella sp.]|uniref:2TM domain-containing protein n=1 Tax=Kaistella sp. TaxID=2782235 RepID=UPI003C56739D